MDNKTVEIDEKMLRAIKLLNLDIDDIYELDLQNVSNPDEIAELVIDALLYIKDFNKFRNQDGFLVNVQEARLEMLDYCVEVAGTIYMIMSKDKCMEFIEHITNEYKHKPLDSI